MGEFIRVTNSDGMKVLIHLSYVVRIKNRSEINGGGCVISMRDGYESTVKETMEEIAEFIDRVLYHG